jgi:hypothetical protein
MPDPRYCYDPIVFFAHDYVLLASEQELPCDGEQAYERAILDTLKVAISAIHRVNQPIDNYVMQALEELTDDKRTADTALTQLPIPFQDAGQDEDAGQSELADSWEEWKR